MITIEKEDLNLAQAIKIAFCFREHTSLLDYQSLYNVLSNFDSKDFYTFQRLFDKMLSEIVLDGTENIKKLFDFLETSYFWQQVNPKTKRITLNIDSKKWEEFNKELLKLLAEAIVTSLKENQRVIKVKVSLDTIESYYGAKDCNKDLFIQDLAFWSIINLNLNYEKIKAKNSLNHELIFKFEI